jgi:hypothetical protein
VTKNAHNCRFAITINGEMAIGANRQIASISIGKPFARMTARIYAPLSSSALPGETTTP